MTVRISGKLGLKGSSGLNFRNVVYEYTPLELFSASEQGVWYDPSDFSTMFQDAAGTTPVTAVEQPVGHILDKSGRGNHATQTTLNSRPVLSARYNLLLNTDTLATQTATTVATSYTLRFTGTGSITLSGTATGTYSAGTHTITTTAGTLTLTVSGSVTNADLRVANDGVGLPVYQRVNTSTDYDTVGFPPYLRFDGSDDSLATGNINFTATDKMTVFAGVRKLSDANPAVAVEMSASSLSNAGTFALFAPQTGANYGWRSAGTLAPITNTEASYAAPITNVSTGLGDISNDGMILRINGAVAATQSPNQGTGNYGNYPLYIGARGGTANRFNGRLYSLIVRGAASTPVEIDATEKWVNSKTRAY